MAEKFLESGSQKQLDAASVFLQLSKYEEARPSAGYAVGGPFCGPGRGTPPGNSPAAALGSSRRIAGEVQEELDIPASTLSHHLEKLKQVGLVNVQREGTFLWYSANTDSLREVLGFLYEECCTRSRAVAPESFVQISR